MIFNDDIVFIHIGKTGGMSCASYLLQSLKPPIYNCHAEAAEEGDTLARDGIIPLVTVNRHCTLRAANEHILRLTGRSALDRQKIIAVIRNPYELEYSFYRHLQKPEVIARRRAKAPALLALAQGNFRDFALGAGYHRENLRQEDYFLLDDELPETLQIVRYENLESAFTAAVAPYLMEGVAVEFPRLNRSGEGGALASVLDTETRHIIYRKHRYVFDHFYPELIP
ncbi:MAG: hypothetical protein Hals2KO_22530 [Halioglobus sp.]